MGREFTLFLRAFDELSRERDPPFRAGKKFVLPRISHKAIREWAGFYGYSRDLEFQEELYAYVLALDTVWVEVETVKLNRKVPDA